MLASGLHNILKSTDLLSQRSLCRPSWGTGLLSKVTETIWGWKIHWCPRERALEVQFAIKVTRKTGNLRQKVKST